MLTQDDINKIQKLKERGYSQAKIASKLGISRSTVVRYWGIKRLRFSDLFQLGPCPDCGTIYPKPKFMPNWKCPYCKKEYIWKNPWFTP
jgi:predicted Zn-ribbon and HTH transcriptional regulator